MGFFDGFEKMAGVVGGLLKMTQAAKPKIPSGGIPSGGGAAVSKAFQPRAREIQGLGKLKTTPAVKQASAPGMITKIRLDRLRNPGYATMGAVGGGIGGGATGAAVDSDNRLRGAIVGALGGAAGGYAGGKGLQYLKHDPKKIADLEKKLKKQLSRRK